MKVTDIIYKCIECGFIKTDNKAGMICPRCNGDIKGSCFGVSNVSSYYDKQLGRTISSTYQKNKLLKKQGLHYAEDNPKSKALRKQAEYFLGKKGNKILDTKARKEFNDTTQKHAKQDFRDRVKKGTKDVKVQSLP